MSSTDLQGWVIPATAVVCILLGAAIVVICLLHMWKKIGAWTTVSLLIGLFFLTVPKWSTLTVDAYGLKATIAKLQQENSALTRNVAELTDKNTTYAQQIAQLQSGLTNRKIASAGDAVYSLVSARDKIGWATFLPTNPNSFDVVVTDQENTLLTKAATKLGLPSTSLFEALASNGLTVSEPAEGLNLGQIPAASLRIAPYARGNLSNKLDPKSEYDPTEWVRPSDQSPE